MSTVLNIQEVSKSFDGLRLFNAVNLKLEQGTINSLFGGNGTGKTTLFNMITRFDVPDSGTIQFMGQNIQRFKSYELAKKGIGKMWQNPTLFPNHTLLENLLISNKHNRFESILGFLKKKKYSQNDKEFRPFAEEVLESLGLVDRRNDLASSISYGQTKLLGLGMLLCNRPNLLMLDEPFSNVGEKTIKIMSERLKTVANEGATILMIEHKRSIAEKLSDSVYTIENQIIKQIH